MNLLRGAWNFLTARRFAVEINGNHYANKLVTAGEKSKVCTISVGLDHDGRLDKSKYVRPLSNYYQQDKVYVTCENERWVDGTLVLDMFVYVTVARVYTIFPKFPEDSYVRFKGTDRGLGLEVKPSNTCSILFKKYMNSNPITDACNEKFVSSYRGDTVKIYVDVIDEFQNKYLEDYLDFHIVSDNHSVKVVQSSTRDRCTGWYVISVRYHKVGKTTIELSLYEEAHLNSDTLKQEVKVIPPPVSAANSFIIQSDIDKMQGRIHEAGQAITFKLKLIDVIGNAISYEESKVFLENALGIVSHRVTDTRNEGFTRRRDSANQENIVPKVRPLDVQSNICEVEFTPTMVGNRRVSLFRKTQEISTIIIRVQPGPLEKLQIVKRDPTQFSDVYRGDTAKIWVKAKDEFGNRIVVGNNLNFAMFSSNSLVKLLSTDCVDDSEEGSHQLTVRWEKAGKGSFDLIVSQGNRQVRKDIPLEVIPPPVSAAKSSIIQSDIDKMQGRIHEAGQAITFKLKLIDVFGNPISYEESKVFLEQALGIVSHRVTDTRNEGCRRRGSAHQENVVPKVRPLDVQSNICEGEFTPTMVGNRRISLLRKTQEISTIIIRVQPGPLEKLQIVKRDPTQFSDVYRGDSAKIWVKAKDEFGNKIVGNNLNFAMFSSNSLVKLLSTDCVDDSEEGSHQLTVSWEKAGKGSFDLIVSQGNRQVRKDIPLEVIPPPVSAANSSIIQSDIDKMQGRIHEAGQAITFKLKLIDVFGNPISYEESKVFLEQVLGIVSHRVTDTRNKGSRRRGSAHQENVVPKVRPLDVQSNICEVEFTPTMAGNRRVSFFRKTQEISTIIIRVQPGPLEKLQIVKRDPTQFSDVYRGDTAKIWVKAKDEFGNRIVGNNLNFAMFSNNSLVKLLSTDCVDDSEEGSHQLTVSWEKAGKGSFDLIVSQGNRQVRKDIPLEVIPPPVSAAKSSIIQSDIDKMRGRIHEAGQAITFKLKLIDVFGNAISYVESKSFVERICLAFRHASQVSEGSSNIQSKGEQNSFKTNPCDINSNACELTITPHRAGERVLSLSFNEGDKEFKKSTLSFTVKPGPLTEIQVIGHEPPASNQNILSSYSKQPRTVVVMGKDEFGNEVPVDPLEWHLDALGDLKQEAKLITGGNQLAIQYSFDKPGRYKVGVKHKKSLTKLAKVPYFEVEIMRAPLDINKCWCVYADEKPIFVGEPQSPFTIRMNLFDRIGNRYSLTADSEFKTELLSIRVNDQACTAVTHESGTEEGEIYVTTVLDNKNIETKNVQVIYNDEPLGEKMSVKVVGLRPYKIENFVRLYRNKKVICCKEVCRGMLADYANLDNINRIVKDPAGEVLLSSDIDENIDNTQVNLINVILKKFDSKTLTDFLKIISLFVEGAHHYRNQANELDREREKWKNKSIEAYFSGKHEKSKACSVIKEKFATLMNQCHHQASEAIFEFYNRGRPQTEIDLHGQLVADSEKMNEYKEQLLSKRDKSAVDIDSMIKRERKERDEAIRKLDERLSSFDHEKAKRDGGDWLEIIDGAGHHSARRGEQKIRPKVEEYLKKKNIKYVEANKGALLITFSEYTGREPCFAEYYCKRCKKTWSSASSWKGFYQRCFSCYRNKGIYSECYPLKLSSLRRGQRRQQSVAESTESKTRITREVHRKLCQKCIELQRDCMGK